MKVVVFGAGILGRKFLKETEHEVQYYVDNDPVSHGSTFNDLPVKPPSALLEDSFERIIVAVTAYDAVVEQLIKLGISKDKIEIYIPYKTKARRIWLADFASLVYEKNISGNVAEAGVYKGSFAALINQSFPDRKLYLFDTFEGFSKKDIDGETLPSAIQDDFSNTSIETVLNKMKYPDTCIIKQGWFPDTAQGINDDFCFINLDMDLYQPTLAGLLFFWDKLVKNGVILVHDFFSTNYPNVKTAVYDFLQDHNDAKIYPIGDNISIAIVK